MAKRRHRTHRETGAHGDDDAALLILEGALHGLLQVRRLAEAADEVNELDRRLAHEPVHVADDLAHERVEEAPAAT